MREGPPGSLGLWLGPYPHPLRPCPPPPAHSSLAEVSPSGTGEPPPRPATSQLRTHFCFLRCPAGGRGGGERDEGPRRWGFPLSSFSITLGRRCQECGRVDSGGTQSSLTYININATFPPLAWGHGRGVVGWESLRGVPDGRSGCSGRVDRRPVSGIHPYSSRGVAGLNSDSAARQLCVPRGRLDLSVPFPHLSRGSKGGARQVWHSVGYTGACSGCHLSTGHPLACKPVGPRETHHCLFQPSFTGPFLCPDFSPVSFCPLSSLTLTLSPQDSTLTLHLNLLPSPAA